ncbi:hypothetical protein PLICRDRAFT_170812 [Plicaturopsis crispa FD-325 SS-3]|nr:hypothetical protein PLICRDRAFT_170812 [Plicaturopsis crispa FD-325 SS-3]
MEPVDQDTFLTRLAALFESTKQQGSIWLTHKRLTYDGGDAIMAGEEDEAREYPCLLRATDGDTKFSTQVSSSELHRFHAAYGTLLKASMATLRKRDKKREKQRSEQAARRKKRMVEPVVIEGAKRGNGRRKRQRRIRAAVRQEESRQRFVEREEANNANS